jgi:hypothetical protein
MLFYNIPKRKELKKIKKTSLPFTSPVHPKGLNRSICNRHNLDPND